MGAKGIIDHGCMIWWDETWNSWKQKERKEKRVAVEKR